MNVRKYFDYSPELELTVAQIGINKWDWEHIDTADYEKARSIMKSKNFDVLPIYENGNYQRYFKTKDWGNFNEISIYDLQRENTVYYRLSFIDILKKFENERNHFYFLADSEDVLGLITISNLNCLAVYHYIYQITSNLERIISNFIQSYLTQEEVIFILKKTKDISGQRALQTFEKDRKINSENNIFQHLYFPTLNSILKNSENKIPEKARQILVYRNNFSANGLYNKIRNEVAHPIGSLFKSHSSVVKINKLITDFYFIENLVS